MKNIVLILISIIFLTQLSAVSTEEEIRWRQVDGNSYINPEGIIELEDIYGFSFMLKSYNKGQYEDIFGKPIRYTIAQYTVDCSKQTYKIGVIDSYDYGDIFVNGDYNRYAAFRPIVHGTAVSAAASKLCRFE